MLDIEIDWNRGTAWVYWLLLLLLLMLISTHINCNFFTESTNVLEIILFNKNLVSIVVRSTYFFFHLVWFGFSLLFGSTMCFSPHTQCGRAHKFCHSSIFSLQNTHTHRLLLLLWLWLAWLLFHSYFFLRCIRFMLVCFQYILRSLWDRDREWEDERGSGSF